MVAGMHNTAKIMALATILFPPLAHAQKPAPGAGKPAAPADSAPAEPALEAASPAAPEVTPLDERVAGLEGKLGGMEESLAATESAVGSLKKLKFSGYIQGRYEHHQRSVDGLKSDGKPANSDRFLVRRGRLKATYAGRNAEYVLQIDATGDGVTLKDAEATFVDTWTPFDLRLTVGQFKIPFGYEVLQSSGVREMPERSGIVKAYFDGERDRGLRLTARWQYLRLAVALINGNGISTKDTEVYKGAALYGTSDPNQFKDVVGRLGVDLGSLAGGVSGYFGRGPMATSFTPASSTTSPPTPAVITYDYMRRTRLGADVQGYLDVPGVGGLALKGEFIWGSEVALDWHSVARDPAKNVKKLGWIVTAVQNVGDHLGVVARLDRFDKNTGKDDDAVTTLGGGVLVHVSGNLKATLVYAHPMEEGAKVDDDVLYAQLQAQF
jgi:hypothetical protein